MAAIILKTNSMRTIIFIVSISLIFSSCAKEGTANAPQASSTTGAGGSLARFTISGNHLYLADYRTVEVYDISNPSATVKQASVPVNFAVETIFPYKDKLFIGSSNGMFIYSISNPSLPTLVGSATHMRACDPVVANDSMSYVTLRGGTPCGPATSGLYIYDIKNLSTPVQKSLFNLSNPYGLGLKDTVVFVCRGGDGLTAVNVKNAAAPKTMYTKTGNTFYDVIPYDNLLIAYVSKGIVLYDMSDLNNLVELGSYVF